ncbi:hypothetical protein N8993_11580 [Pseudomonadales bacterium]|nr:hypothetical protein [Pseudomonadales bacterium]MDB2543105.1 hypothetical protein [Pseudomonadales bacterium]
MAPNQVACDPFDDLRKTRQVVPTGSGQFVYSGDFLILFEALDVVLKEFCLTKGAQPQLYPTLMKTSDLAISGYFSSFPHNAIFAGPCKFDYDALKRVAEITPEESSQLATCVDSTEYTLAPTVCYHCFSALSGTKVESENFTALNKCHRNEVSEVNSLERLKTYWMRELILFGSDTKVQAQLSDTLEFTTELFDRMGIGYQVCRASDPFFADYTNKGVYQNFLNLKQELLLPIFDNKSLAVASFNNHQGSLTNKFGISSNASVNYSGCIGWGYERIIYGLMCQLGSNLADWSKQARQTLQL